MYVPPAPFSLLQAGVISESPMACRNIKFVSWNFKGLKITTKSGKILSHLQYLKSDICFWQETHLSSKEVSRIKKHWMGHLFYSRYSERARRAAIIVHRDVVFELSTTLSHPNGRYVTVSGMLHGTPVILASIYAPTWDDENFISKFFSSIPNLNDHQIIVGGD